MGKEEKKGKKIKVIESDLASQIPLKKHEEWCLSRRSKKGEKGDSGGARKGCREKQEARGARPHWLSGGPVHLMTSLCTTHGF